MPDTKEGREQQDRERARREQDRDIKEAVRRLDEPEPPEEPAEGADDETGETNEDDTTEDAAGDETGASPDAARDR